MSSHEYRQAIANGYEKLLEKQKSKNKCIESQSGSASSGQPNRSHHLYNGAPERLVCCISDRDASDEATDNSDTESDISSLSTMSNSDSISGNGSNLSNSSLPTNESFFLSIKFESQCTTHSYVDDGYEADTEVGGIPGHVENGRASSSDDEHGYEEDQPRHPKRQRKITKKRCAWTMDI